MTCVICQGGFTHEPWCPEYFEYLEKTMTLVSRTTSPLHIQSSIDEDTNSFECVSVYQSATQKVTLALLYTRTKHVISVHKKIERLGD